MTRWLLWTFRCWRGRRCADLEFRGDLPLGAVSVIKYRCASCGTVYQRFGQEPRERVAA